MIVYCEISSEACSLLSSLVSDSLVSTVSFVSSVLCVGLLSPQHDQVDDCTRECYIASIWQRLS